MSALESIHILSNRRLITKEKLLSIDPSGLTIHSGEDAATLAKTCSTAGFILLFGWSDCPRF